MASLQKETVDKLNECGYEAYDVNPQTYEAVEDKLQTDLSQIGLNKDGSYIIISGNENSDKPYSSASNGFSYTYNGVSYTLRYLTVTAADDRMYGKASTVNVLQSASRDLIVRCLDTAIVAAISSVNKPLGTVASICGLSIGNFNTSQTATLNLNCGSNWTRIYTQVWSPNDGWLFGSMVEYVNANSYMSGMYYSASQNKYVAVPQNAKSATQYSSHYSNTEWRKERAVMSYLGAGFQYDYIGPVKYSYGGSVKVTHAENF